MTFYHFGNCIALAYLPYYLTYKLSGLADYGAFWKCIQSGFIFTFTQLIKMLIMATFFPLPSGSQEGVSFQEMKSTYGHHEGGLATLEFFKASMDLIDFIGVFLTLSRIPGRGHAKVLTAGIGWATAELILTRLLSLWVGAKGIEFNWRYMQESFDANISLVHHLTVTTLIWVWTRHDLKASLLPLVSFILVFSVYKGLFVDYTAAFFLMNAWTALLFKAVLTTVSGVVTMRLYSTVA